MKYWVFAAALLICTLGGLFPSNALGVPTFFEIQKDVKFVQTAPSTVAPFGFSFVGTAAPNDGASPIDFDGGTLSFPASSPLAPVTLSSVPPSLQFQDNETSQTIFQTDFPNGTYTFHVTNSANPSDTQTEAIDTSIATAPSTIPSLTPSTFTTLQGLDTTKALTVNFNSFADQSPAANSLIFFAIQDAGGNTPVFDGLQPNVTQDIIPANTLTPNDNYKFFLFFENTAFPADNNGQITLDNRTEGSFTTQAVPEPATAMISIVGLIGVVTRRRNRSARSM